MKTLSMLLATAGFAAAASPAEFALAGLPMYAWFPVAAALLLAGFANAIYQIVRKPAPKRQDNIDDYIDDLLAINGTRAYRRISSSIYVR